jgi:hypothetical protein
MPPLPRFHPADAIDDTIEALHLEQGRDRPAMFWLLLLLFGGALAALPLVKIDLSVRARGVAHVPAETLDSRAEAPPRLVIEAFLRERDAKFLQAGQPATIQYDAFPYQEWGSAPGAVLDISPDAIRLGAQSLFKVSVQSPVSLLRMPDGRTGRIADGMAASVRLVVNRKSLLQLIYQKSEDLFGT